MIRFHCDVPGCSVTVVAQGNGQMDERHWPGGWVPVGNDQHACPEHAQVGELACGITVLGDALWILSLPPEKFPFVDRIRDSRPRWQSLIKEAGARFARACT